MIFTDESNETLNAVADMLIERVVELGRRTNCEVTEWPEDVLDSKRYDLDPDAFWPSEPIVAPKDVLALETQRLWKILHLIAEVRRLGVEDFKFTRIYAEMCQEPEQLVS